MDSEGLSRTNHSPSSQYRISTLLGILYCALQVALASAVSTKLAYLPMTFGEVKYETCEKEDTKKSNTPTDERKEGSLGVLFFNLDRPNVQNGSQPTLSSPFIRVKMREAKFPPIHEGK